MHFSLSDQITHFLDTSRQSFTSNPILYPRTQIHFLQQEQTEISIKIELYWKKITSYMNRSHLFYGMLSSWHDKSTESFLWLSHFCFMILMESAIMYSKDAGDFLGWGYWTKCHCPLTHWGPVTHVCVGKPTIIGSDNGLSPEWRQAIIWTDAGILLIGPLGTYFSEILTGIQTFSFKKMHLKMSSGK